ncbi:hypothetical protein GGX14DRAFT_561994 [Mycena pura]|uniref:Uncharacterized protein n=1 Tax=Mycena pura TaxID=153505 RepID=A0AAD6YJR3_9AGAR|nr:hypothetical protein GGX14DRAFT_561994 [Mycena pura]
MGDKKTASARRKSKRIAKTDCKTPTPEIESPQLVLSGHSPAHEDSPASIDISADVSFEPDENQSNRPHQFQPMVSATNAARVYDMALSEQQEHDVAAGGWQFGCTLTTENVWDAFVLLALLDYNDRTSSYLFVPHIGDQKDRFTEAMRARNHEVIMEGQDEIAHCCDKCMRVWTAPDGTQRDIQLVIGDGLSMGHRRCQICSIVGCNAPVLSGRKSCADPIHHKIEALHYERGKAAFTLRDRFQKHRLAHPHDQAASFEENEDDLGDEGEEWFEGIEGADNAVVRHQDHPGSIGVDDTVPCEAVKSATGNRKYKALFGGVRTHNEQLLVRPCGVIVSRATFYHAEAVSNVLVRHAFFSSSHTH